MKTLLFVAMGSLAWKTPVELVRDLADDSSQVRERASAELYRQGEDVRGVLIDARDRGYDPEIRARAGEILRRLDADERIRWFGGANRVAGFGAQIRTDRFTGAGPFRITLDVMNTGAKELEFPGLGSWEIETPDQETRESVAEAKITVRRFGAVGLRRTKWHSGKTGVRKPALLRPGEIVRYEYVLDVKALPPGDYQVSVEYYARSLLEGADENLRTNTVTLMVRK